MEVENPLDRSESILRTELLPGLLKAVKFNVDRQAEDVALFEIGHVFALPQPPGITPDETERLAVIVAPARPAPTERWTAAGRPRRRPPRPCRPGVTWPTPSAWVRRRWSRPGCPGSTRPGRRCSPARDGRSLGAVGEVDPDVVEAYGLRQRLGYLTLSVDALLAEPRRPWQAHEVSRFPASDIDLAFVVPDAVPAAAVQSTLATAAGSLVERVSLFDVYRSDQLGTGRRSLAFRLRFRAQDRTLDEAALAARAPAGDRCGRRRRTEPRCGHDHAAASPGAGTGMELPRSRRLPGPGRPGRCAGAGSSGPTAWTG